MERRAIPGELSGRRGVATLVRTFQLRWRSRPSLQAFAEVWRSATISLTTSAKPVGAWAASQRLIPTGERSGLQTHTAATFPSFGSVDRTRIVRSNYAARRPGHLGPDRHKGRQLRPPRCSTQRAGIAPPHAEGDGSSGATFDGETFAFICGPAGVVGGVPLTRAMNP